MSTTFKIGSWIALTRVQKFAGTMLVFWPYAWALTMAACVTLPPISTYGTRLVFGFVGICILHSGGCIWNDILDREIDTKVERTKNRPIASGVIAVQHASIFLGIHIFLLLLIISKLKSWAYWLALLDLFPLLGVYPLLKRVTYWPQACLGIITGMGIPIAWAHTTDTFPDVCIILFMGCLSWTIWFDTIYGCQDMKDDVHAGVKSTALLFQSHLKSLLACFGSFLIVSLIQCGRSLDFGLPYFFLSVFAPAMHLAWQLKRMDPDSPAVCWDNFQSNGYSLGFLVWSGIFVEYILRL